MESKLFQVFSPSAVIYYFTSLGKNSAVGFFFNLNVPSVVMRPSGCEKNCVNEFLEKIIEKTRVF